MRFARLHADRVLPGFLVQFGCASDPEVQAQWKDAKIPDEPNRATFRQGTVSYAGGGTDSRSCHLFVALSPKGAELGGAARRVQVLGHVRVVERVQDADLVVEPLELLGFNYLVFK